MISIAAEQVEFGMQMMWLSPTPMNSRRCRDWVRGRASKEAKWSLDDHHAAVPQEEILPQLQPALLRVDKAPVAARAYSGHELVDACH
jgi:hypothetical protein